MRRGVGVRVFGVGAVSLALVAAGLTSVTVQGGEPVSAAALAGVLKKRMDGPEPSVPGVGAPVVRPGPDPDEAVSVGRRPLPEVELPPAATVPQGAQVSVTSLGKELATRLGSGVRVPGRRGPDVGGGVGWWGSGAGGLLGVREGVRR